MPSFTRAPFARAVLSPLRGHCLTRTIFRRRLLSIVTKGTMPQYVLFFYGASPGKPVVPLLLLVRRRTPPPKFVDMSGAGLFTAFVAMQHAYNAKALFR